VPSARPALLRQLGVVSATALVVSNMVGTGIFTTTGFLAGQLGSPPLVLWIWVVGAVCAFLGAICYSELGVNLPSSGGEYVYLTRAFGPTWGFMTGWASFFAGFSAPIAAASLAFSGYIGYFFPSFRPESARVIAGSGDWTIQFGWAQFAACALVAVFTIVNVVGLQRAAVVQNILTAVKVSVLIAFILLGFLAGHGDVANFSKAAVRDVPTTIAEQFAISLFWLYVAYSGWNAATYVAEELRQPARTLPVALAIGTAIVTVLYVGLNFVFIYAAPLEDLKGKLAVGAFAASRLFGPEVAGVFSALMALSLMATVNACLLRDGEKRSVPGSRGECASQVAHAGRRDRGPGRLHHAAHHDAVSTARGVHRVHAEFLRGDERGVSVLAAAVSRMAQAESGQFLLPLVSRAVRDGGSVDDLLWRAIEAICFARGGGDHRHRRAGVSLALEAAHTCPARG
jgi:amino acid transporter